MVAGSTGNAKNHGWIQALRLVLHDSDKVVIRKDPMEKDKKLKKKEKE